MKLLATFLLSLTLMACGTTPTKPAMPTLTQPAMITVNVKQDTETLAQPSLMFTPGQQAEETIKLNDEDKIKITISPDGDITTVLIRGSEDPTIYKIQSTLGAAGSLTNKAFTLTVSSTITDMPEEDAQKPQDTEQSPDKPVTP